MQSYLKKNAVRVTHNLSIFILSNNSLCYPNCCFRGLCFIAVLATGAKQIVLLVT